MNKNLIIERNPAFTCSKAKLMHELSPYNAVNTPLNIKRHC